MGVVRVLRCAALALSLGVPPVMAEDGERCFELLCITVATEGEVTTLNARNAARHAPLSVSLSLRLTGLEAQGAGQAVLAPGEARQLVTLTPRVPGRGTLDYDYTWLPGDFRARPDPSVSYALPFRRAGVSVLQSCDGWFSHRGEPSQAVDFAMPVGTRIHAARAGRVILTRMDSKRGGSSPRYIADANQVLVMHADGSIAVYAHLAFGSARVVPGQDVVEGDVLALSGDTGFSAEPHLHFELYTPRPEGGRRTWPVVWRIGGDALTCPRRGKVLRN